MKNPYLKLVYANLTLSSVAGDTTIVGSADVFSGWIDGDFQSVDVADSRKRRPKISVDIYRLVTGGRMSEIISGFGRKKVAKLCLAQSHIVEFCRTHAHRLRQCADGYGTFFLLNTGDKIIVPYVFRHSSGFKICAGSLSDPFYWTAIGKRQFVVAHL